MFKSITVKTSYARRYIDGILQIKIKHNLFKNTVIIEWNKLDSIIWNSNKFTISSNLLDAPQDFFFIVTTKKELD